MFNTRNSVESVNLKLLVLGPVYIWNIGMKDQVIVYYLLLHAQQVMNFTGEEIVS